MSTIAQFVAKLGKKCSFIVIMEKDKAPRVATNPNGTTYWKTCEYGMQYYPQHFTDKATPMSAYYDVLVTTAGNVECHVVRDTDKDGFVKHIHVHSWKTDKEYGCMWNLIEDLVCNSPFVEKISNKQLVVNEIQKCLLEVWGEKADNTCVVAGVIAQQLNDAGLISEEY